jgi:hypothetical protein
MEASLNDKSSHAKDKPYSFLLAATQKLPKEAVGKWEVSETIVIDCGLGVGMHSYNNSCCTDNGITIVRK